MKKADIHSKLKNTVTQNKHTKKQQKPGFGHLVVRPEKYISGIFLQLYKFGFITRRSIHHKSVRIKIKLAASLTDRWDTLPYPVMGKSQIISRVPKPKSSGIKSWILTAKSQSQTLRNTRFTDAKHPNRKLQSNPNQSAQPSVWKQLEMWANAQRDGRPAVHRWRPLFNAAKFGWCPYYMPCSNAAKTRKPLKVAGVPQTPETISAARGLSSPYCGDMWRRYCCLTRFFSDCRYITLVANI